MPLPLPSCPLLVHETTKPDGCRATAGSSWSSGVVELTRTTPPRGTPETSYHCALMPNALSPTFAAWECQTTTNRPSSANLTLGAAAVVAAVVLTSEVAPNWVPSAAYRAARRPSAPRNATTNSPRALMATSTAASPAATLPEPVTAVS